MSLITLFDKSFLQSLSLDESVWFDRFFLGNVCPLFYIETLADLEKKPRPNSTPEREVSIIADKTPEVQGSPCAYHVDLCITNLMGEKVGRGPQIPIIGGEAVHSGGRRGVIYNVPDERRAFIRWKQRDFSEVERQFAVQWREAVSSLDLGEIAKTLQKAGVDSKSCRSLDEARRMAEALIARRETAFECMKLTFLYLNLPPALKEPVLSRWKIWNYPPLTSFAPYVAHVLTIEVFFQIALAARLIGTERPSNRVDIAYLFYLPFCILFVSSDKLHRRCAPLFMRRDQEFVWGPDLKADLRRWNETQLEEISPQAREQGLMALAPEPPREGDYLMTSLWDRHLPSWRRSRSGDSTRTEDKTRVIKEFQELTTAPRRELSEAEFDPKDADAMILERVVRARKGSWWQVPKALADDD